MIANLLSECLPSYPLYDRYRRPVASMAVLADDSATWKEECSILFSPSGLSVVLLRSCIVPLPSREEARVWVKWQTAERLVMVHPR